MLRTLYYLLLLLCLALGGCSVSADIEFPSSQRKGPVMGEAVLAHQGGERALPRCM